MGQPLCGKPSVAGQSEVVSFLIEPHVNCSLIAPGNSKPSLLVPILPIGVFGVLAKHAH